MDKLDGTPRQEVRFLQMETQLIKQPADLTGCQRAVCQRFIPPKLAGVGSLFRNCNVTGLIGGCNGSMRPAPRLPDGALLGADDRTNVCHNYGRAGDTMETAASGISNIVAVPSHRQLQQTSGPKTLDWSNISIVGVLGHDTICGDPDCLVPQLQCFLTHNVKSGQLLDRVS